MKYLLVPVMGLILLSSCNNDATKTNGAGDSSGNKPAASSETAIDPAQANTEISSLVDNVHNGLRQKDLSLIEKSMAPDALMLGTDPKEVWPYSQFHDSVTKYFADTSFHGFKYDIPQHKIEIHGNSAIIVDQLQINEFTPKVMTRNICHARYENGKWVLDMFSWNLIPKNSDINKINKAL